MKVWYLSHMLAAKVRIPAIHLKNKQTRVADVKYKIVRFEISSKRVHILVLEP